MILLSGHSLTPARKVPMETMSLQLKERESTATMSPTDMSGIGVNSWFKDDTEPGKGIVWRIKSVATAYATKTPTVQLEHVINTLRDRILFGEIKPATITGNPKATSCGAEQAIRYILSFQSDWVLGSFGYNVANPYKFDGETLFEAIEKVSASPRNACWTYDMSVYPFRLNINPKQSGVTSELRTGRNIRTITKTIDRSMMFTRFYPIGKDDLHVDGDFIERNVAQYGVVSKTETDASISTKEELALWANERLDNHAEPTVTIDVDGLELADATGEALDRLTIGRVCRIPLPEYGTTIQEWITALTYQDKIHQPEVVKITLANNRQDVTKIIADAIKGGGKRARTSTKQSKEDHAWFEDTNEHVAMCAIGIIGVDASGKPNWVRLSELVVDGEGIHSKVQSVRKDLTIAETRIEENEYQIMLEARRAQTAEGELTGRITVEADRITQEVSQRQAGEEVLSSRITVEAGRITQEVTDRRNADTSLSSRITQTADAITAEVTRATTAEGNLSGRITVNANSITAEVTRATTAEGALSGRITVNANAVTAEVTRATNQERELRGALEVQADSVGLTVGYTDTRPIRYIYQTQDLPRPGATTVIYYCQDNKKYYEWVESTNSYRETTPGKYIKAGEIVTSINEAGESEAHINANKVYIGSDKSTTVINGKCQLSDVTSDYISNKIASIATLRGIAASFSGNVSATGGLFGAVYVGSGTTYTDISDGIASVQIVASDVANQYKLQYKKFSDTAWQDASTFNKATSTTLSGAWSGGIFTVSASPQGDTFTTNLVQGTPTWSGKTVTIPIEAIDNGADPQYQYATGRSVTATYAGTADLNDVAKIGLDDGWNRYQNYYNAVLYDSGSNVLANIIASANGTGLYFPLYDNYPIGSNGTYTAPTGYVGFRSVLVNISKPTNTIVLKCTNAVNLGGGNIEYTFKVQGTSYSWSSGTDYTFYYY